MANRICWNCGISSHMTQYANAYFNNEKAIVFCTCDNCDSPNIAITNTTTDTYGKLKPHFIEATSRQVYEWLPSEPRGKEYKHVPEPISSPASEAYSCYSIGSYRATILMARSVLEAICKNNEIEHGTLAQKIEKLATKIGMPPLVVEQANEIRYFGNEMAHGDFTQQVSEDDANDVLDLMDIIIDYVYQQPEQLAALKKRRELRKQHAR